MRPTDTVIDFVRKGLEAGHDRAGLGQALARAGWSEPEIAAALDAWAVDPALPPVPRPRAYVSAREAFLYGLLFIALGMIAWHLVQLGFAMIDRLWPDTLDTGGWFRLDRMRWSLAALVAFLPLFLFLNGRINRDRAADAARRRSLVRKWFASVTMLIACLTLLGDAVYVVYALLSGDLGPRFAARAALVAGVAGLVLAYYRGEMDD